MLASPDFDSVPRNWVACICAAVAITIEVMPILAAHTALAACMSAPSVPVFSFRHAYRMASAQTRQLNPTSNIRRGTHGRSTPESTNSFGACWAHQGSRRSIPRTTSVARRQAKPRRLRLSIPPHG
jgi:hypothetical protein